MYINNSLKDLTFYLPKSNKKNNTPKQKNDLSGKAYSCDYLAYLTAIQNVNKGILKLSFSSKKKSERPTHTDEEMVFYRNRENVAINQRKAMPTVLQLIYGLPQDGSVKFKNWQNTKSTMFKEPYIKNNDEFSKALEGIFQEEPSKELSNCEDSILEGICNSKINESDINSVNFKGLSYLNLLNKAFDGLDITDNLSLKDKASILICIKATDKDGCDLKRKFIPQYKRVIDYAKENKEKLTEPVEDMKTEEQINDYFKKNTAKVVKACITIGESSLKQRLEHRLNKFDKSINSISELFSNEKLRPANANLCSNVNSNDTYEPIKVFELTKGLMDLTGKEDEVISTINLATADKGKIKIDVLAKKYLQELQRHYGMPEQKIKETESQYEKWDLNNVHTIPFLLTREGLESHKARLGELVLTTFNDNYKEYIHDNNYPHGRANNKTQRVFQENGLDYDKWLDYPEERDFKLLSSENYLKKTDSKSNVNSSAKFPNQDEDFSIKLWKRNPGKDLFQGTYASQCIALDGINGYAGVDELLYTYAQLVEINNKAKAKPIGNACLYWIKDTEAKKPMLLVDSIGVNPYYENNPQIREELIKFVKSYGKEVAGKEVSVMIGNQFNKLDVKDLSPPKRVNIKILGSTDENKAYLDAIIAKTIPERYVHVKPDKEYLAEIRQFGN